VVDGRLHTGEALHPGDRVRLRLLNPPTGPTGEAFLAVLAVDTASAVSIYYPQAPTAAPLGPSPGAALPNAVELDGTLGGEVIFAFSCPQAVPVQSLAAAVQRAVSVAD